MLSYWEQQSFLHYDYLIVGSGIVGLSTAVALKERQPNKSVLVLERGILPTGASTKNAGFACIGSLTELLDDLQHMSEQDMLTLVAQRKNGLYKLRNRLGDANIKYYESGSYELINEKSLDSLQHLDRLNKLLYPLLHTSAFSLQSSKIKQFGFNKQYVKAIICNHCEGQLDTGKMMRTLWEYALSLGVLVINGAEVMHFEEVKNKVHVWINTKIHVKQFAFKSDKLAICTNAFSKQLLPDIDLQPGRGQVLVTEPIANLQFRGIFHFDEGYYYFRNHQNRVIFGGGRHLDFSTETTTEFAPNPFILQDLRTKLATIVLPNTKFKIDMNWTGIMGFGKNKQPIIQQVSPRIVAGIRLGGMGVAIGSQLGEDLADMLLDEKRVNVKK